MSTLILVAEDPPAPKQPAEVPFYLNPLFMMAMLVVFFLVVMLPAQRRQKREQQNLLANLKPGTKVVTSSGIIGTIIKVKDGEDEITVKSEDTRIRVLRSSVARILGSEDAAESK